MQMTIRFGRLAGIPIGANWTVLVIAWLICWSLATATLPELFPDRTPGTYWAAGIVISVLFFLSLLAHEMAHSLVAQRAGVEVSDITLWMLGGVSRFQQDAERAEDELRISIVGPLASFALAIGFGVLASAFAAAGLPGLVVAVPSILSALNLLLAVFNLLPAYPLDGGRVLRAALWKRSGQRVEATRRAATIGKGFGAVLIGLGVLLLTGGAALNGIWLGVIGLFIFFASTMEAAGVETRELLAGVRVRDAMTPDPITVSQRTSVAELVDRHILVTRASAYPVMDEAGRPVGLVTLDRVRSLDPERRARTEVTAIACPVAEVPTAHPDEPLPELMGRLAASPEGRALVMEGDRLVGIVSHTDVSRTIEIHALSRAVPGRGGGEDAPLA